jgi:hypothetical protein
MGNPGLMPISSRPASRPLPLGASPMLGRGSVDESGHMRARWLCRLQLFDARAPRASSDCHPRALRGVAPRASSDGLTSRARGSKNRSFGAPGHRRPSCLHWIQCFNTRPPAWMICVRGVGDAARRGHRRPWSLRIRTRAGCLSRSVATDTPDILHMNFSGSSILRVG